MTKEFFCIYTDNGRVTGITDTAEVITALCNKQLWDDEGISVEFDDDTNHGKWVMPEGWQGDYIEPAATDIISLANTPGEELFIAPAHERTGGERHIENDCYEYMNITPDEWRDYFVVVSRLTTTLFRRIPFVV